MLPKMIEDLVTFIVLFKVLPKMIKDLVTLMFDKSLSKHA